MIIITHAGVEPNELTSSISILLCKPKASPCVKRPKRLRFPEAPFRPGGRTKSASTSTLLLSPFFTVSRGLPSCIAWLSRSTWCVPKWVPVAIRLVCLLLTLTALDRFVAASYGTQQQVNRQVEEAIVTYRHEESARLAQDMPAKDIT
jgi:hypothetical protein